jgi:hypothetical protein
VFTVLLAGYSQAAGLTARTGSGPVMDLSVGWGYEDDTFAVNVRLHGRFGAGPDNLDYRAVFLSLGSELRFDPSSWHDRS